MLSETVIKLDQAILELALQDAFCDFAIYEDDEVVENLDKYLDDVENGSNTPEQDAAFFELAMPYIENSISIYSSTINEGTPEGIVAAEEGKIKGRMVTGADKLTQTNTQSRDKVDDGKALTEAEEIEIWEGIGKTMIDSAKKGIAKAKAKVAAGASKFKNFLSGFELPKGETPNAPENK